jgi:hypothetical protein
MWEYGNEPDLYSTSSQGPVRLPSWHESEYVAQWLNGTRAIKAQLQKYCPDMVSNDTYGYMAPSFAGTNNHLKPLLTWQEGLDQDRNIKLIPSHKYSHPLLPMPPANSDSYIGGATQPGVTLQGTLMNHTSTVHSISSQVNESNYLAYTGIPEFSVQRRRTRPLKFLWCRPLGSGFQSLVCLRRHPSRAHASRNRLPLRQLVAHSDQQNNDRHKASILWEYRCRSYAWKVDCWCCPDCESTAGERV